MYFTANTYTKDELSAEYKALAKKLHPDVKGGSEAAFKAMKAEYDKITNEMYNGVWTKRVEFKMSEIKIKPFTPGSINKNPPYEVSPEDIKRGAELIAEFLKLINKNKRKR